MLKLFSFIMLLAFCRFANAQQVYQVVDYGQCEITLLNKALIKADLKRYQQENKTMQMNIDCGAKVQLQPLNATTITTETIIMPLRNTFVLHEKGFLGEKVNRYIKGEK